MVLASNFCIGQTQNLLHLFPTAEEESIRVNAVDNGTPKERNPMEHNGRLVRILEQKLIEDVKDDREYN